MNSLATTSLRLCICISIRPSIHASVHLSVSLYICPGIHLSVHLSICLSIYLGTPSLSLSYFFHDCLSMATIHHLWIPIFLRSSPYHPSTEDQVSPLTYFWVWNPWVFCICYYCPFVVVPCPSCCSNCSYIIFWPVKLVSFMIVSSPFSCTGLCILH